jgi:hypothetical protein
MLCARYGSTASTTTCSDHNVLGLKGDTSPHQQQEEQQEEQQEKQQQKEQQEEQQKHHHQQPAAPCFTKDLNSST